jgi:SAM-dependent methyltransferase
MAAQSTVPDDSLYSMAFDQFSRQHTVKRLIEELRTEKKHKILDVGGNNGKTREFFPTDEVLIVDLYDKVEPGYLMANALSLPFEGGSFDFVVSFDVYEHIHPRDRDKFISELIRVADKATLLAAPFDTRGVSSAETELNVFYKTLNGKNHQWLIEHIDNSLPSVEALKALLNKQRVVYSAYKSNNLLLWNTMQSLIFLSDSVKSPEYLSSLNKFYNEHLAELGDGLGDCYRQVYLITGAKNKHPALTEIQKFSVETVREFINLAAISIHELILNNAIYKSKLYELDEKNHDITALTEQLENIHSSRAYRAVRKLGNIKHKILPQK